MICHTLVFSRDVTVIVLLLRLGSTRYLIFADFSRIGIVVLAIVGCFKHFSSFYYNFAMAKAIVVC